MCSQKSGWKNIPLIEGEITNFNFGPLDLEFKIALDDFWLRWRHKELSDDEETTEMNDWNRWATKGAKDSLELTPRFPDQPVVLKPEYPFVMTPRASAKIYIRCPLWLHLKIVGKSNYDVVDLPSVILSHTWFGDFISGDLCYWITTTARRAVDPESVKPNMAICTLNITNKSDEDLSVEKICLRVEKLSLFEGDGLFWSDEMKIAFRGSHTTSHVDVTGKPPGEAGKLKRIGGPQVLHDERLLKKTFASLRSLPGFGLPTD